MHDVRIDYFMLGGLSDKKKATVLKMVLKSFVDVVAKHIAEGASDSI